MIALQQKSAQSQKVRHFSELVEKHSLRITGFIIALIAVFYFLNLRGGHDWGGDFSMYIMNARNIVQGIPYAQTNYIYNVDTAHVGPRAYPPVFPLMLAPIIAVVGVKYIGLKLVGVCCFVAWLFYLNKFVLPEKFPLFLKIIFLLAVGLYPPFFTQVDKILSDIPFLLFCTVALDRINHHSNINAVLKPHWPAAVLTGIIIYLAYGTRTLGILLLPAAFLLVWIKHRRISQTTLVTGGTAVLLIILQSILIPETGSYLDQIPGTFEEIALLLSNALPNYRNLFLSVFPLENDTAKVIIFGLVFGFFLFGFFIRLKNNLSSYELFFLFYLASLMLWRFNQDQRFLFPILALFFLYCLEGFYHLIKFLKTPAWAAAALSTVILLTLTVHYVDIYTGLIPRPVSDLEIRETRELFQAVQTKTDTTDVIAFFKPRVLALFTGRNSLAIAVSGSHENTLDRMKELNVTYLIVRQNYSFDAQPEALQLIQQQPDHFDLVYQNREFQMYRFIPDLP